MASSQTPCASLECTLGCFGEYPSVLLGNAPRAVWSEWAYWVFRTKAVVRFRGAKRVSTTKSTSDVLWV